MLLLVINYTFLIGILININNNINVSFTCIGVAIGHIYAMHVACLSVCISVCLCVGHMGELCINGCWLKELCVRWDQDGTSTKDCY